MSGAKRDEADTEGLSFSFGSGADAKRSPESERTLPWRDADFARISQTITRAAPEKPEPERPAPERPVPERNVDEPAIAARQGATSLEAEKSEVGIDNEAPATAETPGREAERAETIDPMPEPPTKEPGHDWLWVQTSVEEAFPRLIRLKETTRSSGAIRADTNTFREERMEPRFDAREPLFGSSAPGTDFTSPFDDFDEWHRLPPRFGRADDRATEPPETGIVPEPILPGVVFERARDEPERRSSARWLFVAAFALVFGYGVMQALPPRFSMSGGEDSRGIDHARIAALQPDADLNTGPTAAAPARVPAAQAVSPAPTSKSPVHAAPREEITSVIVPPRPSMSRKENATPAEEPSRNEFEQDSTPDSVVLAPGPRNLDESVPLSAATTATASGDLVIEVQDRLAALGYSPGPIDGYLAQRTRTALMRFQRDAGLPMTGEIDNGTWSKLKRIHRSDLRFVTGPAPVTR